MATFDAAALADFSFQSDEFQDTLQAELVDALNLQTSGILVNGSGFIRPDSGEYQSIPQYDTLSGTADQIVTNTENDTNDFGDYKMRAPWLQRNKIWGVENLVNVVAGKDPLTEIARQLANFWAVEFQTTAINVINGCFATALASTHSTGTDYSGNTIGIDGILAAKQKLGDRQMVLTQAIANSIVINHAVKNGIASYGSNSTLGTELFKSGNLPMVAGMATWMDDSFAGVSDVYSSYFSKPGTVVYSVRPWVRRDVNGNAVTSQSVDVEYERKPNIGGGTDVLHTRASFLVHLTGMYYNSATTNPTNAQLATGSNWTKVADDDKKIPIVQLKTLEN
jgi:hypothetical protein